MLQLPMWYLLNVYMCEKVHVHACVQCWREFAKCRFTHFPSFFSVHVDTYAICAYLVSDGVNARLVYAIGRPCCINTVPTGADPAFGQGEGCKNNRTQTLAAEIANISDHVHAP